MIVIHEVAFTLVNNVSKITEFFSGEIMTYDKVADDITHRKNIARCELFQASIALKAAQKNLSQVATYLDSLISKEEAHGSKDEDQ